MPQVLFRRIKAKPANWKAFYTEIEATLEKTVKPDMIAWFNKIVASWKHRPTFKARTKITRDAMQVYVYPTGVNARIWGYVTRGNPRPYPIPKPGNTKAKTLKFRWGGYGSYKARTTPQGGYKGPGKATGKNVLFKRVTHPIVPGRHFEKHIARWYDPTWKLTMKNAVARAMRKARG